MSKPKTVNDLLNLAGDHEVPVIGLLVTQAAQELIKRGEIALEQKGDRSTIIKIYSKIGRHGFMAPETVWLMGSRPRAIDEAMNWLQALARQP